MTTPSAPTASARGSELRLPAQGANSPARFGPRIVAVVVDAVASGLVAALVLSLVGRRRDLPGVAGHLPGSWSLIPLALDYLVGVLLTGQTLGMFLVGLRVVAVDRPTVPSRVRVAQIVVRTFLLFLLVPAVVFDRHGRGLHDRVSGTAVVRA